MALNPNLHFHTLPQFSTHSKSKPIHYLNLNNNNTTTRRIPLAISKKDDSNSTSKGNQNPKQTPKSTLNPQIKDPKPRRGRPSEAAAVEDFIRGSLKETFAAIQEQNSEVDNVIKDTITDDEEEDKEKGKGMVVEEEDPDWPVDAEIGWGIRASEYFEKHPIKNVVGDDGVVIDWEGELDDNLVKEINCLEWETFAFHPSPLIVLVFERYNRASENWKALKELEKAAKVYWNAKDRLPPRTVKLDMNLETDLAYALKVRDCPQILFLRGNRIIYRETQSRTADELVQLIAHFYYKAKKPSWMKDQKLYS